MKVNLQPSIRNHDEEYLKIWYQEIEVLSRKLAKHTINYRDKTIVQASNNIKTVEEKLSNANAYSNQVTEIRKTIIINQETRKRHLKRNKDRNFYNLKYNQKNPRQNDNYLPQIQGGGGGQQSIS